MDWLSRRAEPSNRAAADVHRAGNQQELPLAEVHPGCGESITDRLEGRAESLRLEEALARLSEA